MAMLSFSRPAAGDVEEHVDASARASRGGGANDSSTARTSAAATDRGQAQHVSRHYPRVPE